LLTLFVFVQNSFAQTEIQTPAKPAAIPESAWQDFLNSVDFSAKHLNWTAKTAHISPYLNKIEIDKLIQAFFPNQKVEIFHDYTNYGQGCKKKKGYVCIVIDEAKTP
jgi:hypothetical protein